MKNFLPSVVQQKQKRTSKLGKVFKTKKTFTTKNFFYYNRLAKKTRPVKKFVEVESYSFHPPISPLFTPVG